jgi:hypothetical protein
MTAPVQTVRDTPLARGLAVVSLVVAVFGAPPPAECGKREKSEPVPLTREHQHPSGAFSFRTPDGWTLQPSPTSPETLDATAGDLIVRFVYRAGENGYDSLHSVCMMDRLAGPMDTSPHVAYEYDFVGGVIGEHRALDSAFTVHYDNAIRGHRSWRQRNVTIVGQGHSLCVITYTPVAVWKKSARTRNTVNSILHSLTFR